MVVIVITFVIDFLSFSSRNKRCFGQNKCNCNWSARFSFAHFSLCFALISLFLETIQAKQTREAFHRIKFSRKRTFDKYLYALHKFLFWTTNAKRKYLKKIIIRINMAKCWIRVDSQLPLSLSKVLLIAYLQMMFAQTMTGSLHQLNVISNSWNPPFVEYFSVSSGSECVYII